MSLTYTSIVDAPIDEVYDWHTRPGAITRLAPPWQPIRVDQEAESLRDGTAVLRLPGDIRWWAKHLSDEHAPPTRFVDKLSHGPVHKVLSWHHTHDFAETTDGRTQLTDTVASQIPAFALRPMFTYRHTQLANDLAVHARVRRLRRTPMTVAVTGSRGLVGEAVSSLLSTGGHRVIRLVRRPARDDDERYWDPYRPDARILAGTDAVIHLAGEPIAGRFTRAHKNAIADSRVGPTRLLAECAASTPGVETFVSASAIGIYGPDRGDERLTEDSERGDGYLADVVAAWEGATRPAADAGVRTVHVRTGLAQSPNGGTLRIQYPLFAAGLGGRLGDGQQWNSWIGVDDLADIYLWALVDPELRDAVNAVTPNPVRNQTYARTLGHVLRRPALIPVPSIAPSLLLGREGTEELALASQRVDPSRLRRAGHHYRHPDLEGALRHQLGKSAPHE